MAKKHIHHEHHEHHDAKDESITMSKTTVWQILTAVFVLLFVASLLTGGFRGSTVPSNGNANNPAPDTGAAPTDIKVNLDGAHSIGPENAEVTIIEWSDFQCPFCSRFALETEPQINTNYVDTGKAKFVYKNFPLDSIHPMATPAALAAECAAEQGKFWEYHDTIYDNQAALSTANLKKWAADLSLDTTTFNSCLDSQKYSDKVKADLQEGLTAGIRGTPGFLIGKDGTYGLVSGACPFASFQTAIDASAAGKTWTAVNCQITVN